MPETGRKRTYSSSQAYEMAGKRRRTNTYRYRPKYTVAAAKRPDFIGAELKFLDCAWDASTIAQSTDGSGLELQPASGCTNAISVPAQGDGESQRDGRKYVMKSIWVSGTVDWSPQANQADPADAPWLFFALVLDTQANGATIVSEDVYINPSTSTFAMLPQPLRNLQHSKRFRVLDHKMVRAPDLVAFTDGTNTGSVSPSSNPTVSLNWRGSIQVNCTGTTADVASVSDNAIHLLAVCAHTSYTPTFRGKSRLRFMG